MHFTQADIGEQLTAGVLETAGGGDVIGVDDGHIKGAQFRQRRLGSVIERHAGKGCRLHVRAGYQGKQCQQGAQE